MGNCTIYFLVQCQLTCYKLYNKTFCIGCFVMESSIKVGISSCVLGERVRFDSGHKISNFVTKELDGYFSFVPVCPEVGVGMSVPRPTIRLVSNEERIALVETKNPDN